jgi:hypothetical protein
MGGALFMAHKDVADALLMKQHVVNRKNGAARIAKNYLDPVIPEGLDHHFGAAHFL